jgi:hypothetical protein
MILLKLIWLMCQIIALKVVLFVKKYQGDLVFSFAIIAIFSSLAIPKEDSPKRNEVKLDSFYVKEETIYKEDYWEKILPKSSKFTETLDSLQQEFGVLTPNFGILYKDSVDMVGRIIYTDDFGVGRLLINDPTIVNSHWEVIRYVTDVVVDNITSGSVRLSDVIRDPRALAYLGRNENIRRAVATANKLNAPSSVLLAQDMLESNFGKSSLTQKTKNTGNIKCRCNWDKSLRKQHAKQQVCVQAYDKLEKSNDYYVVFGSKWEGWVKKAQILEKYQVVRAAKTKTLTPKEWCEVLHKSPYASDPRYGSSLWRLVQSNELMKLDSLIDRNISIISDNGQYVYYP